ncbi:MAG TPA: alpha/beta hydrolase [Sphingomonas sp.]|nr:alpha/beta hydrolase [Sphingomonas sp.]
MTAITANGITIEYEHVGDPAAPPVLLIMGLGAQLTLWPVELVDALVARGFRVIRFDNRDIGLSTKFDRAGLPDPGQMMMAMMTGRAFAPPYTLTDMAADAVGLLDALGIPSAHVVGASMGGMIAQLVAAEHPTRVRSLTSIMSTTGNPALPPARPEALAALTGRPMTADRETIVAHGMRTAQVIGSPAYPHDPVRLRARVERDFDRSFSPAGAMRQMAAVLADGDRRERLRRITAPTCVIHGDADPLVPVEGGRDTAAVIPGAELLILPGMGHDLPLPLIERIADAIAATAARAG